MNMTSLLNAAEQLVAKNKKRKREWRVTQVTWIAPRCGRTSIVFVLSGEGVTILLLLLLKYCCSSLLLLQTVSLLLDESLTGDVSRCCCSSPDVHFTWCCTALKHCGLLRCCFGAIVSSHSMGLGDASSSEMILTVHICFTGFRSIKRCGIVVKMILHLKWLYKLGSFYNSL